MNPEQLEQQFVELHAAFTRLGILALRQPSEISAKEFFETTKHISTFRHLPPLLQEKVRAVREERWGIV